MCAFPPPFCGPQERSLLNLEKVTGNDDSAPQQQPTPGTGKEEVVTNVLNLAYSGVLCYEEVQQGVNYNSGTLESGGNSHLVCAANQSKNESYEVGEDLSECNVTGGGVAADIESGREGLLVAVLDR